MWRNDWGSTSQWVNVRRAEGPEWKALSGNCIRWLSRQKELSSSFFWGLERFSVRITSYSILTSNSTLSARLQAAILTVANGARDWEFCTHDFSEHLTEVSGLIAETFQRRCMYHQSNRIKKKFQISALLILRRHYIENLPSSIWETYGLPH